jgi:hypothetical protein
MPSPDKPRDYEVYWTGIPEIVITVQAVSHGDAKAHCMRRVLAANYECKFTEFRARLVRKANG